MKVKIPICPECKKELPDGSDYCHHCNKPLSKLRYINVFSWQLSDRVFLISIIVLMTAFFLPWFPGEFLYEQTPFSAFRMLLNLYDLEIDFIESYDILRMVQILPLTAIILFFFVYLGDGLKKTPWPGIFLFVIALFGGIPYFFQNFSTRTGWLLTLVFLGVVFYYYKKADSNGSLGRISHYLFFIFFLMSLFIYLLDLAQAFYVKLETININETFGFFLAWIIVSFTLVTAFIKYMKTIEDFWLLLIIFIFSIIAYSTLVQPLFTSGALKFFADNFSETGVRTVQHLKIVGFALAIAIVVGVPSGIYITRHPAVAGIVLYISSILITIPSIAMFGLMMPVLSSIDKSWDSVSGIGIGVVPAVSALALYSLLPIIRNTYIALNNIDPATIEAGKGMGMTNFQLLVKLQLPLSAPIIMAGVRTAVVMGVAIAAIAAYIGAGGLGLFVSQGLQMSTNNSVIAGAIGMGILAIVCDVFLEKAEEWITPAGLKVKQAGE